MNKTEIKKNFETVVSTIDAVKGDNKLIKGLWMIHLIYLKETSQITDEEYLELYKEF